MFKMFNLWLFKLVCNLYQFRIVRLMNAKKYSKATEVQKKSIKFKKDFLPKGTKVIFRHAPFKFVHGKMLIISKVKAKTDFSIGEVFFFGGGVHLSVKYTLETDLWHKINLDVNDIVKVL